MTIKNIPVGYKDSPLGIIPMEWEVKRLGDICTYFKSGKSITSSNLNNDGCYPVYGGNGLRGFSCDYTHDGTYILIGRQGALCGNINYVEGKNYISEHAIAVQSRENMLWLKYKLEYWNLNRYSESSAQPGLSVEKLVRYKLTLPPLAEQEKIAEILSTWDKAIEKQTQLIQKLELRKKGLMQQLLTGKCRLPGFSEPWKKVRLGDIGSPYNGLSGKNKENFESGDACFIPYINIFLNERIDTNNLESVEIGIEEHQNKVKYGDIFFTVSSETPNEVGMSSVLLEPLDNTYLNSFCFGYRLNDFLTLSPFFATYLFRAEYFRHCMYILAQGSTRFNISKSDVMNLKINVPSIKEQTAIAQVLTAADREIELAQQKLELLRQQKHGLMQQLLTGKKRVKILTFKFM